MVSLQRDNYYIKKYLNFSEISIILSSADTVSSINLILNIPGCFLYEGFVVVVVLLFYVHSKHLRSCRDGQFT